MSTPTFASFQSVCDAIAGDGSSLKKTAIVSAAFQGLKSDVTNAVLFIRLLLPGKDSRVYQLQDKSLGKILAKLFGEDPEEMMQVIAESGCV